MIDLPSIVRAISAWLTNNKGKPRVDVLTDPQQRLIDAGKAAAAWMEATWRRDIIDPPIGSKHPRAAESLAVINDIIKTNGWTWMLPYKGNGPPQWCTMTCGKAWAEAGLDTSWLCSYWASTDRLADWARYKRWELARLNPPPTSGDRRLYVDLTKPLTIEPRLGDIIIVGDGKRRAGDHGTINMGYRKGVFDTISGNGGGLGPKGDKREGVSRRDYKIGAEGRHPMWLIRPAVSDLVR